jgi:hypothetical protein
MSISFLVYSAMSLKWKAEEEEERKSESGIFDK